MLKNITRIEHKVNDRVFHLFCDSDSPLNEVKEALVEFLKIVGNIEDQVKANQEAQKAQPEVSSEEVQEAVQSCESNE
jgi:hypothetical protein